MTICVGTAGWAIPRRWVGDFPQDGSGLARYAARLSAAEINTTFYRPHRRETFARWAEATPEAFRFSVKTPKTITHEARLADAEPVLDAFLDLLGALGNKLAVLLVQLPPTLAFDPPVAGAFFTALRARTDLPIALEPRHASWLTADAEALLIAHRIARVAADPARPEGADQPGGWRGLTYVRLHGSPRMYFSEYGDAFIAQMAAKLAADPAPDRWCIFDNTASGAAAGEALALGAALDRSALQAPS